MQLCQIHQIVFVGFQTRSNGEEAEILCQIHRGVFAAEEDETRQRSSPGKYI